MLGINPHYFAYLQRFNPAEGQAQPSPPLITKLAETLELNEVGLLSLAGYTAQYATKSGIPHVLTLEWLSSTELQRQAETLTTLLQQPNNPHALRQALMLAATYQFIGGQNPQKKVRSRGKSEAKAKSS